MRLCIPCWIVIVLALAPGCAKPRHTAVVVDVALYQTLNDVHVGEQTALCGLPSCAGSTRAEFIAGWTAAKSQDFNKKLLPAVEGGRGFNQLLRAWQPGTPMPAGLPPIIQSLGESLTSITADFPDGTTKTAILANIGKAQSMILTALSLFLSIGGK